MVDNCYQLVTIDDNNINYVLNDNIFLLLDECCLFFYEINVVGCYRPILLIL